MSFLFQHSKPEPDAPSSQNDKPVKTADETRNPRGGKPKGWPK